MRIGGAEPRAGDGGFRYNLFDCTAGYGRDGAFCLESGDSRPPVGHFAHELLMNIRPSSLQVPPPKDWQQFERNMRDLFEAHWESTATMHGRNGQPQSGVDIYGQPNGGADYHGVQCKGREGNFGVAVTEKELTDEVEKATKFEPRITRFILATTTARDAKIQKVVRRLNERKRKPLTVEVAFWDDILAIYDQHPDVFGRHYGTRGTSSEGWPELRAAPIPRIEPDRIKKARDLLDDVCRNLDSRRAMIEDIVRRNLEAKERGGYVLHGGIDTPRQAWVKWYDRDLLKSRAVAEVVPELPAPPTAGETPRDSYRQLEDWCYYAKRSLGMQ